MGWLYCMAIRSNKRRKSRERAHVANAGDIWHARYRRFYTPIAAIGVFFAGFTLFLIELYIRSIFLTCTDRDAQTFNFDFLIFSLCWELPLDGVVSGKGHPFLEI